jgi:hypothetical protein
MRIVAIIWVVVILGLMPAQAIGTPVRGWGVGLAFFGVAAEYTFHGRNCKCEGRTSSL